MFIHLIYSFVEFPKIYRCWIVWDRNMRIMVVPSILAIGFLGPSANLYLFTRCNLLPLATWIAGITAAFSIQDGKITTHRWGNLLDIASLAISMTVNALVTGLIAFKMFKVYQEVRIVS